MGTARVLARVLASTFAGFVLGSCLEINDLTASRDASMDGNAKPDGPAQNDSGAGGGTGGLADGTACNSDSECDAGAFCDAPSTHNAAGSTKICMRLCCASAGCEAGEICYPTLGGYRVCLPPDRAGRPVAGTKATGTSCGSDSECRSAMCAGGTCVDTCCTNSDCPTGANACRLGQDKFTQNSAFICGAPAGPGAPEDPCSQPADCASNACFASASSFVCAASCCSSANCAGGHKCSAATNGTSQFLVCASPPAAAGPGAIGSPCSSSAECQDRCLAFAGASYCTTLCCADAECGDSKAYACRPVTIPSGSIVPVCVKR